MEKVYELSDKEHNTIALIYVFAKPRKVAKRKVYFLIQSIFSIKELKGIIKRKNKELYDFIEEHENEYCQIRVNCHKL